MTILESSAGARGGGVPRATAAGRVRPAAPPWVPAAVAVLVVVMVAGAAVGTSGSAALAAVPASADPTPVASDGVPDAVVSGASYTPVGPTRVLDTRKPVGPSNPFTGAFGPGQVRDLVLAGVAGVPAGAESVVLNVTVTGGGAPSDLRLYPAGGGVPGVSNLNWSAGRTVPNLVTVRLGDGGAVSIRNQSSTVHVIVDVQGAFGPTGDPYSPVTPSRLVDTRDLDQPLGADADADDATAADPIGPGNSLNVKVTGRAGVPSTATAVALNVTVTGGSVPSHLKVWDAGGPLPPVSNLNWVAGDTRANMVIAPVGVSGLVTLLNHAGDVHVIVDVVGFVGPGGAGLYEGLVPYRLVDTRDGGSPLSGAFGPGQVRQVVVADGASVPVDATAVILNVTGVGASAPTNLRLWGTGAVPDVSNLNLGPGEAVPNMAIVPIGAGGAISVRNQSGTVHVILDVAGYVAPAPVPG